MLTCNDCIHSEVCVRQKIYGEYSITECKGHFLGKADVQEVVRCEECKYKEDCARQMVHTTRDYMLEQNISSYNKVDFCSYGEKRSEGK